MMLDMQDSLLLVIDPQESFVPYVVDGERVTKVIKKLVEIAHELEVPILLTEHYPDGLKPTVAEVREAVGQDALGKVFFSCLAEPSVRQAIEATGKKTLVIVGLESHICVSQTALEANEAGYRVFVVADGVSARTELDHDIAMERLRKNGIEVITWEVAAYEWLRRAASPGFKKVLPHIKAGL